MKLKNSTNPISCILSPVYVSILQRRYGDLHGASLCPLVAFHPNRNTLHIAASSVTKLVDTYAYNSAKESLPTTQNNVAGVVLLNLLLTSSLTLTTAIQSPSGPTSSGSTTFEPPRHRGRRIPRILSPDSSTASPQEIPACPIASSCSWPPSPFRRPALRRPPTSTAAPSPPPPNCTRIARPAPTTRSTPSPASKPTSFSVVYPAKP